MYLVKGLAVVIFANVQTLKNQGYHFEHNYGHGYQHLSVVFALLMMLAFLVDQVQQLCCPLFQAAWAKMGSKRRLWERMRAFIGRYFRNCSHKNQQVIAPQGRPNCPSSELRAQGLRQRC